MKNCPEQELQKWGTIAVRDFSDGIDPIWDQQQFRLIENLVGGVGGLRILDVGCGAGDSSVYFLKRGAYVTGIDLVPTSIDAARSRADSLGIPPERYLFVACDVFDLNNAVIGSSYDLVFCSFFLHHFFGDEVARLALKLASTLKPDGRIVMYENSNRNFILMAFRWLVRALGRSEGVENEYPLDRKRILLFSESCGRKARIFFGDCTLFKLCAHYLRVPSLMPLCVRVDRALHRIGASRALSYRQIIVFEIPERVA